MGKMLRRLIGRCGTALGVSLFSLSATAAEFGIGISLLEDGAAIYTPINLGEHWRIEPVVSIEHLETRHKQYDDFYREITLGAGGFYRYTLSEPRTEVYLGTRLLMLRRDETEYKTTSMNRLHRTDSEYQGYQSSLLAGVDYYFSDAFSIGGEVGLEYTDVEVTFANTMMGRDKASTSDTRTRSNLIARYYF